MRERISSSVNSRLQLLTPSSASCTCSSMGAHGRVHAGVLYGDHLVESHPKRLSKQACIIDNVGYGTLAGEGGGAGGSGALTGVAFALPGAFVDDARRGGRGVSGFLVGVAVITRSPAVLLWKPISISVFFVSGSGRLM